MISTARISGTRILRLQKLMLTSTRNHFNTIGKPHVALPSHYLFVRIYRPHSYHPQFFIIIRKSLQPQLNIMFSTSRDIYRAHLRAVGGTSLTSASASVREHPGDHSEILGKPLENHMLPYNILLSNIRIRGNKKQRRQCCVHNYANQDPESAAKRSSHLGPFDVKCAP